MVATREIERVLWHHGGNYIKVVYVGSDPEHLVGNQMMATELAERAGLERLHTHDDTVRWVRSISKPALNAD